jgi:hypothetical protein
MSFSGHNRHDTCANAESPFRGNSHSTQHTVITTNNQNPTK